MLTDFGSAAVLEHGAVSADLCLLPVGTPDYIAPEVLLLAEQVVIDGLTSTGLRHTYGLEVDWWSVGATVFELATGSAPFFASTIKETYERITSIDVSARDLPRRSTA